MSKNNKNSKTSIYFLILFISLIILGYLVYVIANTKPAANNAKVEVQIEKVSTDFGNSEVGASLNTSESEEIEDNQTKEEELIVEKAIEQEIAFSGEDFYISEISDEIFSRIYGLSYKEDCYVPREDLRFLHLLYKDLEGNTHEGEMIVNVYIAEDVLEIFKTLYEADYAFERIELIDKYNADDDLSILNNNTSAFNFRCIGGSNKISKHGLGLAIDVNPFYNPYIKKINGVEKVDPIEATAYGDRSQDFDYKIDENDMLYQLFTQKGFNWGGHWKNTKDYQHFEVSTEIVKKLYPQWVN